MLEKPERIATKIAKPNNHQTKKFLGKQSSKARSDFPNLIWKLETNISGEPKYLNVKISLTTTSRTEN